MDKLLSIVLCSLAMAVPIATWGQEETSPPSSSEDEAEQDRTLVAVLFLATGGVDSSMADNLTEVLVASVASSGQYAIVGREQFGVVIGVGGEEETLRCAEDPVCLGRIGALVGAEEIVLGSMGERANRYIVNLSRLDVARARLVHRVFRTTPAEVTDLIEAVRESASELMSPPPGAVRITVNVEEATLFVDGEEVRPDPDGVLRGLEPGEHELEVRAEGYGEANQRFDVVRGETLELSMSLSEIQIVESASRPWYRRWWVWTIIGVTVVGAGTAAALAVTLNEPEGANATLGKYPFP